MRIHVTEEARHLSFARHTLKHRVPQLNRLQRHALALLAPVILGIMVRLMVWPQGDLVRHCGVPKDVLRAANRSPEGRALLADALAKARRLCGELGLLTAASRPVWKAMGIWAD
jgi:hypothetical protein